MRLYGNRERDHRQHLEIFDAIANRDRELGKRRMYDHLKDVRRVLSARWKETPTPT